MTLEGMKDVPADDTIPWQITDTIARGTVKPMIPVIAYPHARRSRGDAIAGGVIYRGNKIPALKDKLLFGDITTGHVWYADIKDVLSADDGTRQRSRRCMRWTPDFAASCWRRSARGAASVTPCRAPALSRPGARGPALRRGQQRRALHPDQERRA